MVAGVRIGRENDGLELAAFEAETMTDFRILNWSTGRGDMVIAAMERCPIVDDEGSYSDGEAYPPQCH